MTDRPIIFSALMVRAILDGRKTQTRRVLTPQPEKLPNGLAGCRLRYAKGDRLWVREAWSAIMDGGWTIADARRRMFDEKIVYRADGNGFEDGDGWWPSIHMPREFSRLTLTVTDVRVQRLQDISEADAVAEGVDPLFTPAECARRPELNSNPMPFANYLWHGHSGLTQKQIDAWPHQYSGYRYARLSYSSLWEKLHGPDTWDANPWVVALTFTVRRGNIDRGPG